MEEKKILIIEDHLATVEMLKAILETNGYKVENALDGERGLKIAAAEKPDLVLLDIMLPIFDGIEVCKRLKNNPETAGIPVFIISVRGSTENSKAAREAGAAEYIIKPFDPSKLLMTIDKYLRSA